ncbi:hypothetical protein DFH08DRAFT_813472 [Mycena albidolilacea]|uniref:Uncharacterized protein n=1 Tax=Mycena albidolilacea TaxID=1033008 RepID=A0AAD6ZRT4_9AGAR|nr:hypothetical protein DFH08DRAFT_813472 [Mycena albidolilacea]
MPVDFLVVSLYPPLSGQIIGGRQTPIYILPWVCRERDFIKNLGGGEDDYRDVVSDKWDPPHGPGHDFAPLPYYAADDPAINAARVTMCMDQDPSLERTLRGFKGRLLSSKMRNASETRERRRRKRAQPQNGGPCFSICSRRPRFAIIQVVLVDSILRKLVTLGNYVHRSCGGSGIKWDPYLKLLDLEMASLDPEEVTATDRNYSS